MILIRKYKIKKKYDNPIIESLERSVTPYFTASAEIKNLFLNKYLIFDDEFFKNIAKAGVVRWLKNYREEGSNPPAKLTENWIKETYSTLDKNLLQHKINFLQSKITKIENLDKQFPDINLQTSKILLATVGVILTGGLAYLTDFILFQTLLPVVSGYLLYSAHKLSRSFSTLKEFIKEKAILQKYLRLPQDLTNEPSLNDIIKNLKDLLEIQKDKMQQLEQLEGNSYSHILSNVTTTNTDQAEQIDRIPQEVQEVVQKLKNLKPQNKVVVLEEDKQQQAEQVNGLQM
ncbi:MAG: hypothetical protein WBE18_08125 [Gammaproteobacteria bacterium]